MPEDVIMGHVLTSGKQSSNNGITTTQHLLLRRPPLEEEKSTISRSTDVGIMRK